MKTNLEDQTFGCGHVAVPQPAPIRVTLDKDERYWVISTPSGKALYIALLCWAHHKPEDPVTVWRSDRLPGPRMRRVLRSAGFATSAPYARQIAPQRP